MVLAFPAIFVVAVAVAMLLLLYTRPAGLQDVIEQFLRGVPIVGGQIVDAFRSILGAIGSWISSWADSTIQPLVDLLDFVVGLAVAVVTAGARVVGFLQARLAGIAAAITLGLATVGSRIAGLVVGAALMAARISALVATAAALGSRISSIVATTIPAAISRAVAIAETWAQGQLAALRSFVTAGLLALESRLLSLLGQERLARAAGDAAARAYAQARAAEVAAAAATALALERSATGVRLGELGQAIDGVESTIGQWAIPATIAATIATTIAEVEKIRACNDPMCAYLSPQLGALEAIADAATIAAIAELLHAAAHDPQAAARATIDAVGPVVAGAGSLFSELTGARL